jgi:hypothetical protein
MRALYDTRIEDLGRGDFVRAECGACSHSELIPTVGLTQGLRLPPHMPVLDLALRLRCRECDAKGRAVVSIRWADGQASAR